MLNLPAPSFRRRLAGAGAVLVLTLAAGVAAWAAQPAQGRGQGPDVEVRLGIALNGQAVAAPRVVSPSGQPFAVSSGEGADEIRIDMTATVQADGDIALAGRIHRGGRRIAQPKLVVADGREAIIELGDVVTGDPAASDVLRISVTPSVVRPADPPRAAGQLPRPRDADAQPKLMPAPKYPETVAGAAIDGRVIVEVDINADGVPTAVDVVASQPQGVFDAATVEAVKQWRFEPARKHGKAVPTRVQIPVDFEGNAKDRKGGADGGIADLAVRDI
jgi:TonB family protein